MGNRKFYVFGEGVKDHRQYGIEVFRECWELADVKRIDELDCVKSYGRSAIEMPLEEFLDRIKRNRGMCIWRFDYAGPVIGFTAFVRFDDPDNPERDLFGWAYLSREDGQKIVEKYSLEEVGRSFD